MLKPPHPEAEEIVMTLLDRINRERGLHDDESRLASAIIARQRRRDLRAGRLTPCYHSWTPAMDRALIATTSGRERRLFAAEHGLSDNAVRQRLRRLRRKREART